jgi:hypothetical protein
VFRVPCSVFRVPCSVFRVPCSVFRVPCSVFCVLCSVFGVRCSVFRVRCSVFRVPCSFVIHHSQFILHNPPKDRRFPSAYTPNAVKNRLSLTNHHRKPKPPPPDPSPPQGTALSKRPHPQAVKNRLSLPLGSTLTHVTTARSRSVSPEDLARSVREHQRLFFIRRAIAPSLPPPRASLKRTPQLVKSRQGPRRKTAESARPDRYTLNEKILVKSGFLRNASETLRAGCRFRGA